MNNGYKIQPKTEEERELFLEMEYGTLCKTYVPPWGVICQRCMGRGLSQYLPGNPSVTCSYCSGTGIDPVPWTELFSGYLGSEWKNVEK